MALPSGFMYTTGHSSSGKIGTPAQPVVAT